MIRRSSSCHDRYASFTLPKFFLPNFNPILAGKLIASGAIISGVLVLALPITIIVDNFVRYSTLQNK